MTTSIEKQARTLDDLYTCECHLEINRCEYVPKDEVQDIIKSRDAQWSAVVNELRESIKQFYKAAQRIDKFGYGVNTELNQVITNTEDSLVEACAIAIESLTKADQMLKEMGIKI